MSKEIDCTSRKSCPIDAHNNLTTYALMMAMEYAVRWKVKTKVSTRETSHSTQIVTSSKFLKFYILTPTIKWRRLKVNFYGNSFHRYWIIGAKKKNKKEGQKKQKTDTFLWTYYLFKVVSSMTLLLYTQNLHDMLFINMDWLFMWLYFISIIRSVFYRLQI